jgi:hypothetical protein
VAREQKNRTVSSNRSNPNSGKPKSGVSKKRSSAQQSSSLKSLLANKMVLGVIALALLAGIYQLFLSPDGQQNIVTSNQPAPRQPVTANQQPPRNVAEAVDRDIDALRQLSTDYDLSAEQERDIQLIIESANYSP